MRNDKYIKNYGKTQYYEYNSKDALKGQTVIAKYIEQEQPDYKGNLLIEALPPVRNIEEVYYDLYKPPFYSKEERTQTDEYRLQAIYRLDKCVFPLPNNIEIDNMLSIVLRRGYVNKHIMTPEYINRLKFTSGCLNNKDRLNNKKTICLSNNNSSQSSGFLIIGISGAGKSTAITQSLSYYPQVIKHIGYDDNEFLFTQVTYLKIDCSYNGSIKGICQKFFEEMDKLLGTDYLRKFGKSTSGVDFMIVAMSHVASLHALGVLVIDEVQHLKCNREGETTLNFFVSMMNEINLPIIYIGTYKVISQNVLTKDFRHGRRSSGIGSIQWGFMKNDIEWDEFINDLWKYQWVKNESPLTKELKDLMYKKTLGITNSIVKLFMAVQFYAITSGTETITTKIIERVADEKFILTKDMIEAFETGNKNVLAKLEDMINPDMFQALQESVRTVNSRKKILEVANSQIKKNEYRKKELQNELILFAINFGYDVKLIEKVVIEIINEYGINKEQEILKKEIAKKLISIEQEQNTEKIDMKEDKRVKAKGKAKITIEELKNDVLSNVKEISDGIETLGGNCNRNIS